MCQGLVLSMIYHICLTSSANGTPHELNVRRGRAGKTLKCTAKVQD